MSEYLATVTFQGDSGLSKDRFVNTFAFTGASGPATVNAAVNTAWRLRDFYRGVSGGGTALELFLNGQMSRKVLVKVYDATASHPRPILYQNTFELGGVSDHALPEEVALCLSYYSARNLPRLRGRLYIGPLNVFAAATTADARPAQSFLTSMHDAASRLLLAGPDALPIGWFDDPYPTGSIAETVSWVVHSRLGSGTKAAPVPEFNLATAGWIDNAWDTQRRRGAQPTTRLNFP